MLGHGKIRGSGVGVGEGDGLGVGLGVGNRNTCARAVPADNANKTGNNTTTNFRIFIPPRPDEINLRICARLGRRERSYKMNTPGHH